MISGLSSNVMNQAMTTGLSAEERSMLAKIKDPSQRAQMQAQMSMQRNQQLAQFISNVMRIKADTEKSIIQNIR